MQTRIQQLSKRLFSWKTQSTLLTGLLVTVLGAWFTHWIGPKPSNPEFVPVETVQISGAQSQNLTREDEVAIQVQESRISFSDWQQLVKAVLPEEKRKQIFESYRGERVCWEGVVDQVNKIPREKGGTPAVRFALIMFEDEETRATTQLGRAPAMCMFPADAEDELDQITPGQKVTIQGTLAAPETLHGTLLGTRLYNCEVLLR